MSTSGALSPFRFPSLVIRVYPPGRVRYRGPMTSSSFWTARGCTRSAVKARRCESPLARLMVMHRSTNGRTARAFAAVVRIRSCRSSPAASDRRRDTRAPTCRLNLVPRCFRCLISHHSPPAGCASSGAVASETPGSFDGSMINVKWSMSNRAAWRTASSGVNVPSVSTVRMSRS